MPITPVLFPLTLDAILLGELVCSVQCFFVAMIPDRDVSTSLCQGLGNLEPDTSTRSRDNSRAMLQTEQLMNLVGLGSISVVLFEDSIVPWDAVSARPSM